MNRWVTCNHRRAYKVARRTGVWLVRYDATMDTDDVKSRRKFRGTQLLDVAQASRYTWSRQGITVELAIGTVDEYLAGDYRDGSEPQSLRDSSWYGYCILATGCLQVVEYKWDNPLGGDYENFVLRSKIIASYGSAGWVRVVGDCIDDELEKSSSQAFHKKFDEIRAKKRAEDTGSG